MATHTLSPPSAGGPTRRVLRWFTASCLLSLHVAALGAPVEGGDKPTDAPYRATARTMSFNAAAAGTGYPAHYGSSPFSFSDVSAPSGSTVVNDRDSGTVDRYLYRSGSGAEITIPLQVGRYVGDKEKLLANNLLSRQATILFPGYDIDSQTSPVSDCDGDGIPDQLRPEVNKVYFNGELIGEMVGDNGIWRMQRFTVDIDKVNFPSSPGAIASNELTVHIDTANADVPLSSGAVGCVVWAVEVDWAVLQFEVASPIVLVPGLSGRTDSFANSGYIETIQNETGLPVELVELSRGTPSLSACTGEGAAMRNHAEELREKVGEIASRYRTESVHLIGHSKGGLDSRAFVDLVRRTQIPVQVGTMSGQPLNARLDVPSLATHGSPHLGTALADSFAADVSVLAPVVHLLFSDLCALTTYGMERFNQQFPTPSNFRLFAIGAEADRNGNGVMDDDEAVGNQVSNPRANKWYQINRNTESIAIEYEWILDPISLSPIPIPRLIETPTSSPQPNDGMVTVASATQLGGATPHVVPDGANHGTILDQRVQRTVIQAGINGALQWGQK